MGRPTDDPKINQYKVRLSDEDIKKLDYCCEWYGLAKAEVIRQGINTLYEKAQTKK